MFSQILNFGKLVTEFGKNLNNFSQRANISQFFSGEGKGTLVKNVGIYLFLATVGSWIPIFLIAGIVIILLLGLPNILS